MAICKFCRKSGWLLKLDNNGLCKKCASVIVSVIYNHCRIIVESNAIIQKSKNISTRLSRLSVAIKSCRALEPYADRGIPTLSQHPADLAEGFKKSRKEIIRDAIREQFFLARQKADNAATQAGKLSGYGKAAESLAKLMDEVDDVTALEHAILDLRRERDNLKADALMAKAEVEAAKSKPQKAIELLIEAMMSLLQDGTPDDLQEARLEKARARILDLGGTPPPS